MNTANIIIGLHDGEDDSPYRPGKLPAVHHAIVLGVEESTRYYPVCGVTAHEEWTAEDTQEPTNCKRCLAWMAKPRWAEARRGLFGAIIQALVGSVRQSANRGEDWVCSGCDALSPGAGWPNVHKPECPWPMLNEMLELEG